MQMTRCPKCGRDTPNTAACQACSHAPPPEVASWKIEKPSPDVLAWAAQTFNEAEYWAAFHETEKTGGAGIDDLITEMERKVHGGS